MIGQLDPRTYDCKGRVIHWMPQESVPLWLRDEFAAYLDGDLTVQCNSLDEVQAFLLKCRYVSDPDQFGVGDYWMHPQHFERTRRGDCEDFALWTWRQLLAMGLDTRFTCGRRGRNLHAWVTFSDSQAHYLLEPVARRRRKLSQFDLLLYKPVMSIALQESALVYHEHEPRDYSPTTPELLALVVEAFRCLAMALILLPWYLAKKAARPIQKLMARRETQEGIHRAPGPPPILSLLTNEMKLPYPAVLVNDLLPGYKDLVKRLAQSGIPVSGDLDSSSRSLEIPVKKLATFGLAIPPRDIRNVVRVAADFVDFIQITYDPLAMNRIYIGSYGYRTTVGQPMAKLTPELESVLLDPSLSAAALRAAIARHAGPVAGGQ